MTLFVHMDQFMQFRFLSDFMDESYLVLIHIRQHASFLVTAVRVMSRHVFLNAEVAQWPRIWRQETRCLSLAQLARRCCCLRTQKQTSSCWPQAPVLHQCALTWGAVHEEIIAHFLLDGRLYRVGIWVLFHDVGCCLMFVADSCIVAHGGCFSTTRLALLQMVDESSRVLRGSSWVPRLLHSTLWSFYITRYTRC